MSSLVILFAALLAVIGTSNKVESAPFRSIDLNKILGHLQQQRANSNIKHRPVSSDSSDSDDSGDSDDSDDSDVAPTGKNRKDKIKALLNFVGHEDALNSRIMYRSGRNNYKRKSDVFDDSANDRLKKEIIDLINSIGDIKNNNEREDKPNSGQKSYKLILNINDGITQSGKNIALKDILVKLFSKMSSDEEGTPKPKVYRPKKRLKPNRLIPSTLTINDVKKFYEDKNKKDEATGFEDYSKIYIVLNPQAVPKNKNKNSLYDIVSKVLSISSQTSEREYQVKKKPRRYKGFVLNQNYSKRRSGDRKDQLVHAGDIEMQRATFPANNYK